MAKRTHQVSFKGEFDFERMVIAEYDKKTENTSFYSIKDALKEFDGKILTLSAKEEDGVSSVEEDDLEED
ncbi:hypothetical protein EBB07_29450 [Paenibacillaceae bacterium]|nr:hypothetical protein EBB07_29450 [Paenibacillaceae bacterium]